MIIDPATFTFGSSAPFIVFEGINGCGKTTLQRGVSAALTERNVDVCMTREPGGTPLGLELRKCLLEWTGDPKSIRTELLLFAADRAEHVDKVIRPAVQSNRWVLCDRYIYSTIAFQAYGRGIERSLIDQALELATEGLRPDLVVLIDIDVREAAKRLSNRERSGNNQDKDSFESEQLEFHERIRAGYLACAERCDEPFLVLEGKSTQQQLLSTVLSVVGRPQK